jgi:hypothetical protein
MEIFDKLFGRKKQLDVIDNWIEALQYIPNEYMEELTQGLILSLGPDKRKLACMCLILPIDYFKTELNEKIKIKVRLLTTETPYIGHRLRSFIRLFANVFGYKQPPTHYKLNY